MSLTIPDSNNRKVIHSSASFLKKLFSRKDVSVICFTLAIVIKILFFFYFQQIVNDKLAQAVAGKNLAEGHGLTIKHVHVSNLSKETYEPLVGWPPAYSVVFAIIYSLCKDLEISIFIIEIIGAILFFILLRKVLRQLNFPDYLINGLVLFNGFAITDYMEKSTPTDFITLLLFAYTSYLTIKVFTQKNPVLPGILLIFFNFLSAWFKYMYIPVTFIIPGVLLLNGWLKKDRKLLLYGTCTLVFTFLGVITLLSIQEPFVAVTEKGIFWSNLLLLDPVLFSSFMNLKFFLVQFSHITGLTYETGAGIFRWINLVPFLTLWVLLFYASLKRKGLANNSWQLFNTLGTLTGICIFLVLALLSLTHSAHVPLPKKIFWTYVMEDRYFVILQFIIVVLTARWLFMNPAAAFPLKKWAQGLFLFLFTIEILHGAYFLARNFTFDRRNSTYRVSQNRIRQYIDSTIRENKKQNTAVVVTGNSTVVNSSTLLGGNGIFDPAEIIELDIHANKPTKILAVVSSLQLPFFKPFIDKEGTKLETRIGNYFFYSYYVKPTTTLKD